jgi:hypothetical protein
MYVTRKMPVGLALTVLGMTVFAFPDIAMVNQNRAALRPMPAAALLLATGIALVIAEIRMIWMKSHSGRR